MPLSKSRDYLSIGELLDAVRPDFPDVTISKIRFLESEGLIAPDRTESGYRKFYPKDVSRLRTILELQRDHFLPLRVIKDRLDHDDVNGRPGPSARPADGPAHRTAAAPDVSGVQLTRRELLDAAGLSDAELAGLEDFGLLEPGDDGRYGDLELVVARTARRLLEFGAEARHLRMFRQFAEREVAFFEQIVSPLTRRRDPAARAGAAEAAREMVGLAARMHDAVLRSSARALT